MVKGRLGRVWRGAMLQNPRGCITTISAEHVKSRVNSRVHYAARKKVGSTVLDNQLLKIKGSQRVCDKGSSLSFIFSLPFIFCSINAKWLLSNSRWATDLLPHQTRYTNLFSQVATCHRRKDNTCIIHRHSMPLTEGLQSTFFMYHFFFLEIYRPLY